MLSLDPSKRDAKRFNNRRACYAAVRIPIRLVVAPSNFKLLAEKARIPSEDASGFVQQYFYQRGFSYALSFHDAASPRRIATTAIDLHA